ncbi:hypothetical protein GGX14DRAFT_655069 [Mycena pura]|uniref:Uncharacterized protein n=1 Tax=Mycena pura TaxID=153505 RepID=A0AAD6V7P6_9AGAR|nr:hypothetical protein GGX14DRAFT_655069 [Mycena pura]
MVTITYSDTPTVTKEEDIIDRREKSIPKKECVQAPTEWNTQKEACANTWGEQVSPVLHDAPKQLQSVKMLNIMKGVERNDRMEVGEMTQGIMGNGGKRAARSIWGNGVGMRSSMKPRGVSMMRTRRRAQRASRKRIGMARPAERTSSRDTAQDASDAQEIALIMKGQKAMRDHSPEHRPRVSGERKGAGPIICQKYNAGLAKAGGLGRNHELRSAATGHVYKHSSMQAEPACDVRAIMLVPSCPDSGPAAVATALAMPTFLVVHPSKVLAGLAIKFTGTRSTNLMAVPRDYPESRSTTLVSDHPGHPECILELLMAALPPSSPKNVPSAATWFYQILYPWDAEPMVYHAVLYCMHNYKSPFIWHPHTDVQRYVAGHHQFESTCSPSAEHRLNHDTDVIPTIENSPQLKIAQGNHPPVLNCHATGGASSLSCAVLNTRDVYLASLHIRIGPFIGRIHNVYQIPMPIDMVLLNVMITTRTMFKSVRYLKWYWACSIDDHVLRILGAKQVVVKSKDIYSIPLGKAWRSHGKIGQKLAENEKAGPTYIGSAVSRGSDSRGVDGRSDEPEEYVGSLECVSFHAKTAEWNITHTAPQRSKNPSSEVEENGVDLPALQRSSLVPVDAEGICTPRAAEKIVPGEILARAAFPAGDRVEYQRGVTPGNLQLTSKGGRVEYPGSGGGFGAACAGGNVGYGGIERSGGGEWLRAGTRRKRVPRGAKLVRVWATEYENWRKQRMRDVRDVRLVPGVRRVQGELEAAVVTVTLTMRHLEGAVRLTCWNSVRNVPSVYCDAHRRGTCTGIGGRSKRRCGVTPITGGNPIRRICGPLADADAFEHTLTLFDIRQAH